MFDHREHCDGINRLDGGKVIWEIAAHELNAGNAVRLGWSRIDSPAVPPKLPQQFAVAAADVK